MIHKYYLEKKGGLRMEKKMAENPIMEVVVFEAEDVIASSGNENVDDGEWTT